MLENKQSLDRYLALSRRLWSMESLESELARVERTGIRSEMRAIEALGPIGRG
jgi:hypothetical protein